MTKIDELSRLSRMITDQWKPGVVTNAAFSAAAFQSEIDAGSLYAHEVPGGLLLLRRRDGYDRLNFYLQPDAHLSVWQPSRTTVLEIPARDRDLDLRSMGQLWQDAGFVQTRSRLRMTRRERMAPISAPEGILVRPAEPAEQARIMALMGRIYEPMTSCLPTDAELAADIADEDVVAALTPQGELAGFLHLKRSKRTTECRHLAVEPEMRRRGIAAALFDYDFARARTPQYQLWVDEDNLPALGLYEKLGYSPDGWRSTVWVCKKKGND